jgi:hypothetical protein
MDACFQQFFYTDRSTHNFPLVKTPDLFHPRDPAEHGIMFDVIVAGSLPHGSEHISRPLTLSQHGFPRREKDVQHSKGKLCDNLYFEHK